MNIIREIEKAIIIFLYLQTYIIYRSFMRLKRLTALQVVRTYLHQIIFNKLKTTSIATFEEKSSELAKNRRNGLEVRANINYKPQLLKKLALFTYIGYFFSGFFGPNMVSCGRASKTESM